MAIVTFPQRRWLATALPPSYHAMAIFSERINIMRAPARPLPAGSAATVTLGDAGGRGGGRKC
jgi:hypothetical protein